MPATKTRPALGGCGSAIKFCATAIRHPWYRAYPNQAYITSLIYELPRLLAGVKSKGQIGGAETGNSRGEWHQANQPPPSFRANENEAEQDEAKYNPQNTVEAADILLHDMNSLSGLASYSRPGCAKP
jgi:hypothetical protein